MASERILLVDDDETVRSGLRVVLEASGFKVSTASSAADALRLITAHSYDLLLTDLHMPEAGDGLTLITAMRHVHPQAATLLLSADPNLSKATAAILSQVDEVILKPVKAAFVIERVRDRVLQSIHSSTPSAVSEDLVAGLLQRELDAITAMWLKELARVSPRSGSQPGMTVTERTEHLPEALRDIIFRLRYPQPPGSTSVFSMSALQHGARRRRQGVGAASLAEEARALQVAIFRLLAVNQESLATASLPSAVMTIADEVNAQLLQAIEGYENELPPEPAWGFQ